MVSLLPPVLLLLVAVTSRTDALPLAQCQDTGSECGSTVSRGVTDPERAEILAAHNTIRRNVKSGVYVEQNLPAARQMNNLTWDSALAEMAQSWANQCRHTFGACTDDAAFGIGQNILANITVSSIRHAPTDWTHVVTTGWFGSELVHFKQQGLVFSGSGENTGAVASMTQVIWAATLRVGCGHTAHATDIGSPWMRVVQHYVCNYAPGGNVLGQTIYVAQ